MGDSDTVEDGSLLEGTVATGSLGVKGSSDLEKEAGAVLVPRRMLALSIVLLLWPRLALRKALVLQRALVS